MRKIFLFMMVTLDNYFEGPNAEIDWHNVDAEFNEFAIAQLKSVDALLFGRLTYQMMASYWPTPAALEDDPIVAARMNHIQKIVFSKTLDSADWENTLLVKENAIEALQQLKQQPGKDMAIFGSAELTASLSNHGLIDEYRIMVNPVVLGSGKPLFAGLNGRLNLKLLKAKTFKSGNVLLYYQPAVKEAGAE
jgi:dihydrofolate reductase